MNGIVVIDKPAGWTSHDVIAKLRGALKIKKIGHGGTLDPMATGVLPVFIGRATRAVEFFENAEKEYMAGIKLGIVTDTQDITGNVLSEREANITENDLLTVLKQYRGEQKQIPPMYSAVKKDGRKLYELARKGLEIPRQPRDIFISELELLDFQKESSLRIVCSKGTYIRTLCHDIGASLGCGGTLSKLRRTRAGAFTIDMAHALDDVLAMALTDSVSSILKPVDSIFDGYPSVIITESEVLKAKNGALCNAPEIIENGRYKVYAPDGEFLLLGEAEENKMRTVKSFFEV